MLSYVTYPAAGSTYQVAFAGGPALRRSHVKVYRDGVLATEGVHYNLSSNGAQVVFVAGQNPSTSVTIVRQTPATSQTRVVDFAPGATLTERDLDEAHLANLYAVQEIADRVGFAYDPVTGASTPNGTIASLSLDFGGIP
jgi:hypothetical protein